MTILTFLAASDAASADASDGGGSIFSFLLLPLMLVAMYFLIIRPNSKKRKAQQSLQSALGVGDEVMTTAGIIGTITGEDGPTRFWLEIDDDVQVRIARGGISGRLDPDAIESEKPDADAAESKSERVEAPQFGETDAQNVVAVDADDVAERDS